MRSERRVVQQAFRFELDPNRDQGVLVARSVGASRYVYNWGLAESKRQYEVTGKRPRLGDLKAQLVGLKRSEAPWLYEVSAHIGQSALKDLNVAFERFFKSVKGEGPIKDTHSLSERVYECDVCGLSLDRDENAAINLRRLAPAELPVDRREVTPVERKALATASADAKPASMKQEATANSTSCSTRRSTPKDVLVRV